MRVRTRAGANGVRLCGLGRCSFFSKEDLNFFLFYFSVAINVSEQQQQQQKAVGTRDPCKRIG